MHFMILHDLTSIYPHFFLVLSTLSGHAQRLTSACPCDVTLRCCADTVAVRSSEEATGLFGSPEWELPGGKCWEFLFNSYWIHERMWWILYFYRFFWYIVDDWWFSFDWITIQMWTTPLDPGSLVGIECFMVANCLFSWMVHCRTHHFNRKKCENLNDIGIEGVRMCFLSQCEKPSDLWHDLH